MAALPEKALGDVHSKDIAAIWVKIYGCLRDTEVGKGLLVCKTSGKILAPLVKDITLSSPVLDQELLSSLACMFHTLRELHSSPRI